MKPVSLGATATLVLLGLGGFSTAEQSPAGDNELALRNLWSSWYPGALVKPDAERAIEEAAGFLARVGTRLTFERAAGLTVGGCVSAVETCVKIGELYSFNNGPAQIVHGVHLDCTNHDVAPFYGVHSSGSLEIAVPAGVHYWRTGAFLPGFPWTPPHQSGKHMGDSCIVSTSETFSFVAGSGAFSFERG